MRYKPVFKCSDSDKEKFKTSQCLLTVSVGQEVHEGEKFAATVELVNASFASCILLVDDSLQRHSMALDKTQNADFFYEQSLREGDLWLERNKKYYDQLVILKDIVRWDFWLNQGLYASQKNKIVSLIQSDLAYQEAFEDTVNRFLTRYAPRSKQGIAFDKERGRQLCFDYLIEECTAFCFWPSLNCQFEVYPGQRVAAMHETHKHFVLPDYPDFLYAVALKFKNRKQFQPQNFESLRG